MFRLSVLLLNSMSKLIHKRCVHISLLLKFYGYIPVCAERTITSLFLCFNPLFFVVQLWNYTKTIGHFRITSGLVFEASLGAHLSYAKQFPFTRKLNSFSCEWKLILHMKRWAPRLASKTRPEVIRKWPIIRLRLSEYCWIIPSTSSRWLFDNIHLAIGK